VLLLAGLHFLPSLLIFSYTSGNASSHIGSRFLIWSRFDETVSAGIYG
jgi:hypothetical protein